MNAIAQMPLTMSSREIADLVNSRHDDVKRSIDRLVERGVIVQPPLADEQGTDALGRPRTTQVYRIGKRDSYVIVAQLSPEFTARLVDRWQELEAAQPVRLPTTAEAFAHVFQMVADQERRQVEQQQTIATIADRVEIIEQLAPLKAKPQAAETRSEIRKRMNAKYALSEPMVDFVLDKLPYSIRPFGMVKNSHENAQGSSFPVYWIRDVTALFKRFVSECRPHSATMFVHDSAARPFKLKGTAA